MLSAVVLALVASPFQAQGQTGSQIVSKMLEHYSKANTLVGQIRYTLTSPMSPEGRTVDTWIQYQRPNLIYIRQVANIREPLICLVTCDGKKFSYDPPLGLEIGRKGRILESMTAKRSDGTIVAFNMTDVYKASVASLVDRSVALDIAISRPEDLAYVNGQWATVKLDGKVKFGDREVYHIYGNWRPSKGASIWGTYEMFITEEGDLVRFVRHETIAPEVGNSNPIPVTSVWDVNLNIGAQPDASLFKVVR